MTILPLFILAFITQCYSLLLTFDDTTNITIPQTPLRDFEIKALSEDSPSNYFYNAISNHTGVGKFEVLVILKNAAWKNKIDAVVKADSLFNLTEADISGIALHAPKLNEVILDKDEL